ncbi:TonB-dependent receptor [Sphingomonas gilva]|uniref:TonB-dependent receptor n=1 Tax=Sphingomonas gilva TaxID=2305907 RepID=A0A396RQS5_9SPHN|nr:TonB-dependent receptor [Sphingomonas gilva]RHW18860.1 TonB-dependent receptor [Sphingomonas gilva]
MTMRSVHGRLMGFAALSVMAAGAMAAPARAQEVSQPDPEAQAGPAQAPEPGAIIVTAQKRAELLQDVPISIDVVGGDTLDDLKLNSATDLQYVVPGLASPAQSGPRNFGFFIRGVGTNTFSSETIEPSTAYVVDGVVMGQSGATLVDLPDIERIEVLRGPQSTLFGKNASAGVINIVTRRPSETLSFRAGVSVGWPNDDIHAYGYVSGPLDETLRFSLSGRRSVRQGYITNIPDGRRFNDRNEYGFRGKLEWEPSNGLRATLIGDYWKSDANCCIWTIERFGPAGAPNTVPPLIYYEPFAIALLGTQFPGRGNQNQTINGDVFANVKSYGASLQLDLDVGDHTLTSISAWRGFETVDGLDSDSAPVDFLDVNFGDHDQDQISQELRIASPTGGFIDYVAGVYYFRQRVDSFTRQLFPVLAPILPFFSREVFVDVTTRNMAVFGQANLNLTDQLTLTLGGRVLDEEQTVSKNRLDVFSQARDSASVSGSDTAFTWRGAIEYNFTPDIMAFASITRGYKGGGFDSNIAIQALLPVGPEKPTSYEAGLRTAFPAAGLTFNITGFYADIDGYQTAARDPVSLTFPLTNGDARTQGFEAEATWRPSRAIDLTFTGGVAYTDAEWKDFANAPCAGGQTAAEGCVGGVQDLTGEPLPFAPEWAFNLGADFNQPIGNGLKLGSTVNYNHRSRQVIGFPNAPDAIEPGYGLLGGAVSLGDAEDRWKVSVFGKNLTDENFRTFAFNVSNGTLAQYRVYESRRIIGVALDLAF